MACRKVNLEIAVYHVKCTAPVISFPGQDLMDLLVRRAHPPAILNSNEGLTTSDKDLHVH